ncbi:MAG: DHHW family protein [Bacillota bacterium]
MKRQFRDLAVVLGFMAVIFGFSLLNILKPDTAVSISERRQLAARPKLSQTALFSGAYFQAYEQYLLDQFVFRTELRSFKAFTRLYLLNQQDNNDIYLVGGNISKLEYPLNEKAIGRAAEKLNSIYRQYLQGMRVSYAIIPDKNYFMAANNGYLSMDYNELQQIMQSTVKNMDYLNLFDLLTLDDYYKTDLHWRQEKLINVANKIFEHYGLQTRVTLEQFVKTELYPFYGSYYGQAALKTKPDTLLYLNNKYLEKALVFDYETEATGKMYLPEKFEGVDPYDVFLSGAKALLTITNPHAPGNKELLLFRDSFSSSLAPLLAEGYAKITLIDLRYIAAELLEEYLQFSPDQDVLFLYNTQILNNSILFK